MIKKSLRFTLILLCSLSAVSSFAQRGKEPFESEINGKDSIFRKKASNEKYIKISLDFNIQHPETDIKEHIGWVNIKRKDILLEIAQLEKERIINEEKKRDPKPPYAYNHHILQHIDFQGTEAKSSLNKTLISTGYIDTTNKFSLEPSRNIYVECSIKNISTFNFAYGIGSSTSKFKVHLFWKVFNHFDEILDTFDHWEFSRTLFIGNPYHFDPKLYNSLIADASKRSFVKFFETKLINHLSQDNNTPTSYPQLILNRPQALVSDVESAVKSTVIIKSKPGHHGSGFAISNNGYILTNYHVIAGEWINELPKITVILENGKEVPADVIRFNKFHDLALLKIEENFEHPFLLSETKGYSKHSEVYAVGTPKSIELGQSLSVGIISGERTSGDRQFLQLGMSVNSGNSGGPVFDKTGALHGIVTSKLFGFGTEGIAFAIPTYKVGEYLNLKVE